MAEREENNVVEAFWDDSTPDDLPDLVITNKEAGFEVTIRPDSNGYPEHYREFFEKVKAAAEAAIERCNEVEYSTQ
jgi:hypothetical protein